MAGHCAKRLAVAAGEDGAPEGRPIQVDDCENIVLQSSSPGNGSDDPMGQTARTEQYQNNDLLQQMTILCQTVQNLETQMQEGVAAERTRRQQDFDTENQKRQDDDNKIRQDDDRQDEGRLQERTTGQTTGPQ